MKETREASPFRAIGWLLRDKRIKVEERRLEEMRRQRAQKDTEIEALKEANRLEKKRIELLTHHKY